MFERYDFVESERTARIAGALAHELNNPLQGLLSSLTAANADDTQDVRFRDRMVEITGGVRRLSRAVESFAVMYENFPRAPEHLSPEKFHKALREALSAYFAVAPAKPQDDPAHQDRSIVCYAAETVRLVRDTFAQSVAPHHTLAVSSLRDGDSWSFEVFLAQKSLEQLSWNPIGGCDGISGMVVILDEIVQMCGGRTRLACEDSGIAGLKLSLRTLDAQA